MSLEKTNIHSSAHPLSGTTVLIVDDDVIIHEYITLGLDNLGITDVFKAESGDAALKIIGAASGKIDVIFCDLNMPNMDGIELLRHISTMNYDGAVVLMSGEDARILKTAANLAEAHNLKVLGAMEKPLKLDNFKQVLTSLKDSASARGTNVSEVITESDIRSGINANQFHLVYQPKVDMQTRKLIGVEALARWIHPEKGFISPVMFIAAAEECGVINDLTDNLFIQAFQQIGHWHKRGLDFSMSVNMSMDSLDRLELPEYMVSCAAKSGIDIAKLTIEITESRLMQDVATSLEILSRLCLKGVSLSIDDFGTGYSTMEKLRMIPFSELKIDRSFVTGAAHDQHQRAILESSIELAKKLNIKTVAEGIETNEDWELVKSLGCDIGQGYLISKPLHADELLNWLDAWQPDNS